MKSVSASCRSSQIGWVSISQASSFPSLFKQQVATHVIAISISNAIDPKGSISCICQHVEDVDWNLDNFPSETCEDIEDNGIPPPAIGPQQVKVEVV